MYVLVHVSIDTTAEFGLVAGVESCQARYGTPYIFKHAYSHTYNSYIHIHAGVLAEFESRFNLLLDPLLVAVRFYEQAHSPLPHTYTDTYTDTDSDYESDDDEFRSGKDRTSIVSNSSPTAQTNIKVCIHTYIHLCQKYSLILTCIHT